MFLFMPVLGMYVCFLPMDNFRKVVKANIIRSDDGPFTTNTKKNNILGLLTGHVTDSMHAIQDILAENGMVLVYGNFLKGFDIKRIEK